MNAPLILKFSFVSDSGLESGDFELDLHKVAQDAAESMFFKLQTLNVEVQLDGRAVGRFTLTTLEERE